jgi:4-hydroxy-tetrahydrodipicolinate synthase
MKTLPWTGVYPAVTTKFTPNGDLVLDAFLYGIHAQVRAGADGIIIGGSLGESSTNTHDERISMLSATLEHVGNKVPVLVNIAEGSTRQAVALAQRAEASGARGLMVLPPMMYKPTEQEVIDFFADIASGSGLPILVYNNPVDYKIETDVEVLQHETIQAVKIPGIFQCTRLINHLVT